jgi:hypothetical protein
MKREFQKVSQPAMIFIRAYSVAELVERVKVVLPEQA